MSYLILQDFKRLIQSENLSQILGGDYTILDQLKDTATAECISYLTQKYLTSSEFSNTRQYDITATYQVGDRVYLDADAFSASVAYAVNDLVTYQSNVYYCSTIHPAAAWNPAHFTLLGAQYALYYVDNPYIPTTTTRMDEFNYQTLYAKDDYVWWKTKYYRCVIASVQIGHDAALQAGTIQNIPLSNVFPDDPQEGVKYWGAGTAYNAEEKKVTNTTYWTQGDNRNPQMVQYCIDIALYHLHSRISPRNIPDLRVKRYDDAISWLKKASEGDITADMPVRQPRSGGRIRYGGNVKQINTY